MSSQQHGVKRGGKGGVELLVVALLSALIGVLACPLLPVTLERPSMSGQSDVVSGTAVSAVAVEIAGAGQE